MTTEYTDEDMAAVGRALMAAITQYAPKGWSPADCPSELVGDLHNECEELRSDAERYRKLRDVDAWGEDTAPGGGSAWARLGELHGSEFDAFVDSRAESAIETPAKVSPCAGHAVQQEADASRDWPEDFPHENGQYMNTCHVCKNTFIGHKRRVVCKVCNNGFIRAQQDADEVIGLAQALEQHRARKIVDAVSALPVGGKHEHLPSPFHAGYQLACEEVTHRLLTEEWDGCMTPPGQRESDGLVGLRGCNSRHGGMRAVEPCGYRMRTTDPSCTGCAERDEDRCDKAARRVRIEWNIGGTSGHGKWFDRSNRSALMVQCLEMSIKHGVGSHRIVDEDQSGEAGYEND